MAVTRENIRKRVNSCKHLLRGNLLMVFTCLAVVAGFVFGFILRDITLSEDAKMWLRMPGDCFLNLLRLTIVPLIVSSVITAVATMNPHENGKVGGIQLAYLTMTNVLGATIGTVFGLILLWDGPAASDSVNGDEKVKIKSSLNTGDIFADLIRNLFPESVVRVTMQKIQTFYKETTISEKWDVNMTTLLANATKEQTRYLAYTDDMNVLGLMFACLVFGLAASTARDAGKPFVAFFSSATDIIIIILQWFVWVAPIGILSLMTMAIAEMGDPGKTFQKVGFFVLSVSLGVACHQLIFIPGIFFIAARKNPYLIYPYSAKAWLVAFASTSSACTMPYIYKMMEIRQLGWNKNAASFAIPVAVAMNADGSALYIANACFFLAQISGTAMGFAEVCLVWILTVITTMALPSVPSSSLVAVVIICGSMGISTTSVGLLFTVEWILDRLRTTSNVLSEIVSVSFVNHFYMKNVKATGERTDHEDNVEIGSIHSHQESKQ